MRPSKAHRAWGGGRGKLHGGALHRSGHGDAVTDAVAGEQQQLGTHESAQARQCMTLYSFVAAMIGKDCVGGVAHVHVTGRLNSDPSPARDRTRTAHHNTIM